MKLMSYVNDGLEWGIVINDSVTGKEYVIDPKKIQYFLDRFCSDRTVGYFLNRPHFFEGEIPATMVEFLELGQTGMRAASDMKIFIERFITQSDRTILNHAATPVDEAKFLPPVPEPRLLWGLVGNSPSFSRSKWEMKQLQLVPQGHQRPVGAVIAHNCPTPMIHEAGGNAEFAFVIGKKGRNIKMTEAMGYVAGYTVVNDMGHSLYADLVKKAKELNGNAVTDSEAMSKIAREKGAHFADEDIYTILSSSWTGKCSDRMCAVGPWIVTPDEIGDPYDLEVFTKRNGERLGRGNTCALLVGIERAIAYYSSFATLYPGDIIHLGSVAKDGYPFKSSETCKESCIQSEIERIGTLNTRVTFMTKDEETAYAPAPGKTTELRGLPSLRELNDLRCKNLYNVFGNTTRQWNSRKLEPKPFPRFLCVPGSCVATAEAETLVFSDKIKVSAELCAIIGKTTRGIDASNISSHIAGFSPMICVEDYSLMDQFEHATIAFEREWALPEIYGRWGDAYNIVADSCISSSELQRNAEIVLKTGGLSECYNCADYLLWFDDVISFINRYITLFPGDIVTLGSLGPAIELKDHFSRDNSAKISLTMGHLTSTKTIFRSERG